MTVTTIRWIPLPSAANRAHTLAANSHSRNLPPTQAEIDRKISSLFDNVKQEERDHFVAKAHSFHPYTLFKFMEKIHSGPEYFARYNDITKRFEYPDEIVFMALKAYMEEKISEAMFVTVTLLWSNVNYFGQMPKVVNGQDLQELVEVHGLREALSDQSISGAEKKIYAFAIEQPYTDKENRTMYYPKVRMIPQLPEILKVMFNALKYDVFKTKVPLHFISKSITGQWELRVPSFYLMQHDGLCKNVALVPEISCSSFEKIYRYFINDKHPYALPFPDRENSDIEQIDTRLTGKKFSPGLPAHDAFHAYLKSMGKDLGIYQIIKKYLQFTYPQLESKLKKKSYYPGPLKQSIDEFLNNFKDRLVDFEIRHIAEQMLKIPPNSSLENQLKFAKEFLFEEFFVHLLLVWDEGNNTKRSVTALNARKEAGKPIETCDKVEKAVFKSFAEHIYPNGIPSSMNISQIILEDKLSQEYGENLKESASILVSEYNKKCMLKKKSEECLLL